MYAEVQRVGVQKKKTTTGKEKETRRVSVTDARRVAVATRGKPAACLAPNFTRSPVHRKSQFPGAARLFCKLWNWV